MKWACIQVEIVRQSLYTRDIQTTSKPQQICGHLRSGDEGSGCCVIVISVSKEVEKVVRK